MLIYVSKPLLGAPTPLFAAGDAGLQCIRFSPMERCDVGEGGSCMPL